MRAAVLGGLLAALTMLGAASESASQIPASRVGAWAPGSSSCEDAQQIFLLNSAAILVLERPPTLGAASGGIIFAQARVVRDALVVERPETAPIFLTTSLDDWTRCDTVPSLYRVLFGEAVALFEAFDHINAACEVGSSLDCVRAAFDFADVNGDRRLTHAEISRVFRAAAFYVGYEASLAAAERRGGTAASGLARLQVGQQDLLAATALGTIIAPFITSNLIASYDYDGTGSITLEEMLQDRGSDHIVAIAGTLGIASGQTAIQLLVNLVFQGLGFLPRPF